MYKMICYQTIYVRQEGKPPNVKLTPDEESASLDPSISEVKQEMEFLYKYAFTMFTKGVLSEEQLPNLVKEELCDRMKMTGEEFEAWIGA